MLTPTDVHLITGLLTKASSPENVKVELGSLIYDSAAEKLRDVDITVAEAVGEIKALKRIRSEKTHGTAGCNSCRAARVEA